VSDATALGHTRLAIIDLTAAGNVMVPWAAAAHWSSTAKSTIGGELQEQGERFQSTSVPGSSCMATVAAGTGAVAKLGACLPLRLG
jgi:hypothetical protein